MKKRISLLLIFALSVTLLIPLGVVTVSADEPTLITDQAGLAAMTADGSYKLANDVTISGEWENTVLFKGTLDGDGHTITFADGATVKGGLFRTLNQGATIKNLNIEAGDTVTWQPIADAAGSGSPCVGGVAASVEAGNVGGTNKWGDTAFVSDPENVVTIQNITVTANIAISGTVARPGKDEDKVAGGGIIGDLGIISLIKNCTFNGSISDEPRGKVDMNTYESGYSGIVGVAIRNGGPIVIMGCVNNANITGYGQAGGILGYSKGWGGGETSLMALVIQKCVNNGTITCLQTELGTTGNPKRAAAGGIVGYAYVKNGATADFLHNINYGNVVAVAEEDVKIEAGICGVVRQKETVTFEGNVNLGSAKSQMINTGISSGTVNYVNNYAASGTSSDKYTAIDETAGGQLAMFNALNEIYPGVYVYEENKIALATGSSGSDPSSLDVPEALTLDVTVPEPTGTAITNQKELEAMTADGTYYLANDVEIKGSFRSLSDFSGVLHGNGHTIVCNGVELRGGFFKSLAGGKVYNLSFTEVPETAAKNNYRSLLSANEIDVCFGTVAGYGYGTIVGVTTNCAIGAALKNTSNAYVGGLIGILTDGDTLMYNCRNTGKVQGGIAGGIVGSASCENGKMEISRCVNWGEVTSSSGTAGGIVAAHRLTAMRVTMSLLVLENVNYGAISTTGSRYCGGIAGSVGSFLEGKASFLRNVNYGTITANAAEIGCPGGVIGYVGYQGILIAGNLNLGSVSGSSEPNRLIAKVESGEGVAAENNFAAAGTAPATVGETAGTTIDENTLATLNAAYPNAYANGAEGKIALQWATGLSATAPEVTYTLPAASEDPVPGGETTAVDSGTDEPGTEAPKPGKKRGCKSSVGIGGAVALVMILGGAGAMAATRRKED
ncbi:MAG: hypothetical protein J5885_04675 [Clostridia bacterium]|nr:hypothetical protein [Clostridia bacterium]